MFPVSFRSDPGRLPPKETGEAIRKPGKFTRKHHSLSPIKHSIASVISLIAHAGHGNEGKKDHAYSHAMEILKFKDMTRIKFQDIEFSAINKALKEIDYLVPLLKQDFLNACAECIQMDNNVTAEEWGLLRVIAACIGCPMPIMDNLD